MPWDLDTLIRELSDENRVFEAVDYIFNHPNLSSLRGHPDKIIAALDHFSDTKKPLMHVGRDKGGAVVAAIHAHRPSTMVELGGYLGYSALMFGAALRAAGGRRYLSLEISADFAALATRLVELAGLQDVVEVVVAPSHVALARLVREGRLDQIDMLFVDHWKYRYLPDLHLIERLGLLKPNVSVVIADNVLRPGAPEYAAWVRASPAAKREMLDTSHPDRDRDLDLLKVVRGDGGEASEEVDLENVPGNPDYVYESETHRYEMFDGGEDILEITEVVGMEKN